MPIYPVKKCTFHFGNVQKAKPLFVSCFLLSNFILEPVKTAFLKIKKSLKKSLSIDNNTIYERKQIYCHSNTRYYGRHPFRAD